jgi:hypothetical protein
MQPGEFARAYQWPRHPPRPWTQLRPPSAPRTLRGARSHWLVPRCRDFVLRLSAIRGLWRSVTVRGCTGRCRLEWIKPQVSGASDVRLWWGQGRGRTADIPIFRQRRMCWSMTHSGASRRISCTIALLGGSSPVVHRGMAGLRIRRCHESKALRECSNDLGPDLTLSCAIATSSTTAGRLSDPLRRTWADGACPCGQHRPSRGHEPRHRQRHLRQGGAAVSTTKVAIIRGTERNRP